MKSLPIVAAEPVVFPAFAVADEKDTILPLLRMRKSLSFHRLVVSPPMKSFPIVAVEPVVFPASAVADEKDNILLPALFQILYSVIKLLF